VGLIPLKIRFLVKRTSRNSASCLRLVRFV
jgi:hypothetical protein